MTDISYAQELLQEAFPIRAGRNVKAAIGEAFKALQRHEHSLPADMRRARDRRWTERRVRSIWERAARRIDHYEIEDLTAVAVEEARFERARLLAREMRLAAFISAAETGARQQMDHA